MLWLCNTGEKWGWNMTLFFQLPSRYASAVAARNVETFCRNNSLLVQDSKEHFRNNYQVHERYFQLLSIGRYSSKEAGCCGPIVVSPTEYSWRKASSRMLRRVALVRTNVSEELRASIIRLIRIGELRTTLAVTSNRRTLRRNTKLTLYFFAAYVGC
jgi:hypothetical protein